MTRRAARRRFLRAVAVGAAAALVTPVQALAQAAAAETGAARKTKTAAPKTAAPGRRTALPAEVQKLKGFTDDALKAIRAFPLPAGSPPAFVFHPLRARRGKAR